MLDDDEFPKSRKQTMPCGECHLLPAETCDICGASSSANDNPTASAGAVSLTALAAEMGVSEDEAIERIGDILARRIDD
jgi:hypothetical protein